MNASMGCREEMKLAREALRGDAAGTAAEIAHQSVTLIPVGPLPGQNGIEMKGRVEETDLFETIETVVVMTAESARNRAVLSVIAHRRVAGIPVIVADMFPATATAVRVAAPARHESARVNTIVLLIAVDCGVTRHRRHAVSERRAPTRSAAATKPPAEVPPHREDNALRLLVLLVDPKYRRPVLVRVHPAGTERLHRHWK